MNGLTTTPAALDHSGQCGSSRGTARLRHFLVPVDFSTRALAAVRFAVSLASQSDGTVTLLHVVEEPALPRLMPGEDQRRQAGLHREARRDIARMFRGEVQPHVPGLHLIREGHSWKTIVETAGAMRADLVVMCNHGWSGLARWINGSVSELVVRHSPRPVLVLHETEGIPPAEMHELARGSEVLRGSQEAEAGSPGPRMLLIGGDLATCVRMTAAPELRGWQFAHANGPEEGAADPGQLPFDIALLDLDTVALRESACEIAFNPVVPVILAASEIDAQPAALAGRAAALIEKPIEPRELAAVVRRILSGPNGSNETARVEKMNPARESPAGQ